MARRRRQNLAFPVRRPARAARASGLLALATLSRRMAARRMAAGRKRAEQILAFDLAGRCRPRNPRCSRQNALADRARLSRRGAWMSMVLLSEGGIRLRSETRNP